MTFKRPSRGIAPNILSERLKRLERDALVMSRLYTERPPRAAYDLTAEGKELAGALRLLAHWGHGTRSRARCLDTPNAARLSSPSGTAPPATILLRASRRWRRASCKGCPTASVEGRLVFVRPSRRSMERRPSLLDTVDGALFAFAGASAVWLAYLLLTEGLSAGWQLLLLIPFWVVVTYLMLPRLHRILTRVYVPGYFIGRTRTSDGLLGDPVNLTLRERRARFIEP